MLSRIAYLSCTALIMYIALLGYPKWENKAGETSLGWDAATYYWYLPATFIYQDLKKQAFSDLIIEKYQFIPNYEPFVLENGNVVITYSSGLALMHLPAFLVAHMLAKPLGFTPDGFSLPYQIAVQLWSLLAALVGLWYFRKLLLRYFSDKTTAVTLLLLVFGTNYLNYTAVDVTLTHSWLFSIFTLTMLNAANFHATAKRKYALRVGLLVGLAILIRPSEIIVILLPLLWGLEQINSDTLGRQIKFLKANSKTVLLAVAAALFVVCIQVAYWLYVAGTPLVYSYGDKGFSWLSPHFFDFTFSYRSGWLVYTPLLIFAFLGMLVYLRYGKNKVAIISFFLLNYYVISAWDVWWYGGMGGRAMVQSYAVAFFMVAALVEWLFSTRWLKWPAFSLMALFAYVNIWFTYNAHAGQGLYDPNGMTKAYYWAVVGRFRVPEYKEKFKDTDEYFKGTPKNRKLLFSYGFEDDQTASDVNPISGKRSLFFYPYREFSPKLYFPLQPSEEDWLRAVARVRPLEQEWENWRMVQFIVGFNHHGEKIKDRMIRLNRFCPPGEITEVYFDIEIPDQPFDSVYILFWTPGSSSRIQIDEISVYSFME